MLADFKPYSYKSGRNSIEFTQSMVMGILNTTEDSFFDGGKYHTIDKALAKCESLLNEGADIIDIGGQSSRPGAIIKSLDEELKATVPIVDAIHRHFPDIILSIDTFRAPVAFNCVQAGASIVNDISAGDDDPDMLKTIQQLDVPYVAMHKKGTPTTMQNNISYENVNIEVNEYFKLKLEEFEKLNINKVILDPGFGFGKTIGHNFQILNQLESYHQHNKPLLIGISRKSMIWKTLKTAPDKALNGSTCLNTIALLKGAHIIRVHDIKEAKECVILVQQMQESK